MKHEIELSLDPKTKQVWWHTVDYGRGCRLYAMNSEVLVIQVPGQHYASGQLRAYSAAHKLVLEILKCTDDIQSHLTRFICRKVISFDRAGLRE